jgi:hypothetical protein
MSNDLNFIKRPLTNILEKVSWEISCLDAGFTTIYVLRHILDSTFLQITGALEQKVKYIYWELGNNSCELKDEILTGWDRIKTYSRRDGKNKVLKIVGKEITRLGKKVDITQKNYWTDVEKNIKYFYENGKLTEYYKKEYEEYKDFNLGDLAENENSKNDEHNNIYLFKNTDNKNTNNNNKNILDDFYDKAINYRNRIAHNTKSSLNNLPDFTTLRDENYKYENIFLRFAIMLLADRTFIEVFDQYEKARENS